MSVSFQHKHTDETIEFVRFSVIQYTHTNVHINKTNACKQIMYVRRSFDWLEDRLNSMRIKRIANFFLWLTQKKKTKRIWKQKQIFIRKCCWLYLLWILFLFIFSIHNVHALRRKKSLNYIEINRKQTEKRRKWEKQRLKYAYVRKRKKKRKNGWNINRWLYFDTFPCVTKEETVRRQTKNMEANQKDISLFLVLSTKHTG